MAPRETENNAYAFLGGGDKQRALAPVVLSTSSIRNSKQSIMSANRRP